MLIEQTAEAVHAPRLVDLVSSLDAAGLVGEVDLAQLRLEAAVVDEGWWLGDDALALIELVETLERLKNTAAAVQAAATERYRHVRRRPPRGGPRLAAVR